MRMIALLAAASMTTLLGSSAAFADGSIAIAHPADDNGWAIGVSYDAGSRAEADSLALGECRTQRDASNVDADCRIVSHYDGQCMALAKDTGDGGTAWGWAVAPGQGGADATAMANCRSFAGSRAGYCQVTLRYCDGGK